MENCGILRAKSNSGLGVLQCNDANMLLELNLFSTFLTLAKSNNLVQVCGISGVSKSQIAVLLS
jgi:hypothetical protein